MKKRLLTPALCLVLAATGYVSARSGWLVPAAASGSSVRATAGPNSSSSSQRYSESANQKTEGEKTDAQAAEDSVKARLDQLAALLDEGTENPMNQWSVAEIQTAIAHLNAHPEQDKYFDLRQRLAILWAKTDPSAAWQASLQFDDGNVFPPPAAKVLLEFARTNPAAALELAASMKSPTLYQAAVFAGWLGKDPHAALAWLQEHPGLALGLYDLGPSLEKAMQHSPAQFMESLLKVESSDNRRTLTSKALEVWLNAGKASALHWFRDHLQSGHFGSDRLRSLLWHPLVNNSEALALIQSIPVEADRMAAFSDYAAAFARKDPDATLAWINSQTDPELRKKLGSTFARSLRALSPEEQTALLRRLPPEIGEAFTAETTFDNVQSDMDAGRFDKALAALDTLPASSRRHTFLHDIGWRWAEADPVAAANWANTLPPSNERDMLLAGFVAGVARQDAHAAIEWLNAIENLRVRLDTGKNLFNRWHGVDPAAATAWLQSARLYTPPVMQQLLFDAPVRANSIMLPNRNFGQ
jgi:hypothetical protein